MKRLLNVVSDNKLDATVAVMRLFHLVNSLVGYEQMRKPNHGIVPIIPSSLLCSRFYSGSMSPSRRCGKR